MARKENNTISQKNYDENNLKAIVAFNNSLDTYARSTFGKSSKQSMSGLGFAERKSLAEHAANSLFANAIAKVGSGENGNYLTTNGVASISQASMLKDMKGEYQARMENNMLGGQAIGNVTTAISSFQNLQSVLLYPGVVMATYNKIMKTTVEKKLFYDRMYDVPYLISHTGKRYDYYGTLRDSKALSEIMGQASATAEVKMPVKNSFVENITGTPATTGAKANLVDSYNHGKDTPINGPRNFLNRGVEIVSIDYDGTEKAVQYISNGNQTQSGQVNDVVATITLKLSDRKNPAAEPIRINGTVSANGDIDVLCTDPKVKSITFKFVLPAIGMQRAASIGRQKSPIRFFIQKDERLYTTINDQYIQDGDIMIEEDIIELFNRDVITIANQWKDDYTIRQYIANHKANMAKANQATNDYVNTETVLNRYAFYVKGNVEINNLMTSPAVVGTTGFLKTHNDMLANEIFKVTNEIVREIQPQEKNFVIVSSSQGGQWISDINGNNVTQFNMVADGGDGTIAGLATPFVLNKININNMYSGWFVATDRLESERKEVDAPAFGAGAKGYGYIHNYTILPRFEESKDSMIFLSGPEMFTRGTSTPEFTNYEAINFEFRWDIACINKTIGEIVMTEAPMQKK
nr:MAG TPA: hypothetical protein [Caudoviricetes sp.]